MVIGDKSSRFKQMSGVDRGAHAHDQKVNVWTVDDGSGFEWYVSHGADMITANRPEGLMGFLKSVKQMMEIDMSPNRILDCIPPRIYRISQILYPQCLYSWTQPFFYL